ncbi:hypothetical protein GWK47_006696 [Chionoecetes opilio]|uniref:Uncharacterized protein n=1 Tax=Chionoecetes opilio TaxID=41210 RepID=A0A8J4YC46_CHIOP|nr:hypothetical protein GWK47_006696 [Chionoecetes opilio]
MGSPRAAVWGDEGWCLAHDLSSSCLALPHFNSLPWNLRPDYFPGARVSCDDRHRSRPVLAGGHSLARVGLGMLAPYWTSPPGPLPLTPFLATVTWSTQARRLINYCCGSASSVCGRRPGMTFVEVLPRRRQQQLQETVFFSLVHLPVILLLMISKKHFGRNKKTETTAGVSEGAESGTKHLIPVT